MDKFISFCIWLDDNRIEQKNSEANQESNPSIELYSTSSIAQMLHDAPKL